MMNRDPAVSVVIGEVLMISLVLILVPVLTVYLLNQMPEDRAPSVTVKMSPISQGEVHLYHKGGDWVKYGQIHITVNGAEKNDWKETFQNQTFDLGDNLTVKNVEPGSRISLVVHNSVVFSGVAGS